MIVILDYGSQYTQLIARRLRELEIFCEILPFDTPVEIVAKKEPLGLILSGGPSSVYHAAAPKPDFESPVWNRDVVPARQACSHSASIGSRTVRPVFLLAHFTNATASFQLTSTTG